MDGIANFLMTAVGNPVVGLILVGMVIGFILFGRK